MKEVLKSIGYKDKIAFYTLVTRFDEYKEMVDSAKKVGFDREGIEFYYFDNKNTNDFDGYSGLNEAIRSSSAEYIIFCHQDILFKYDDYTKLLDCIQELEQNDPKWAVAGNAGKDINGHVKMKITDPHGENQTYGPFPSQVISLDENFLVINNKYKLGCSHQLSGFHMYGIDLCTNAINIGLSCYVIDFHLHHKSAGNIDQSFFDSRQKFIEMQQSRLNKKFFSTTCTNFYVSSLKWINRIINKPYIIRIYIYLKKNFR